MSVFIYLEDYLLFIYLERLFIYLERKIKIDMYVFKSRLKLK